MAHLHKVYDTDAHFSIDVISKTVKNETPRKVVLIQNDHNSERFSFDIDRLIEGHDMTQCDLITVHYNNIEAATRKENRGVYEVKDIQASPDNPDKLVFSWLISENATQYVGTLNFLITFECTNGDVVEYRWSTGINSEITIASGMNNGETVTELFPDILAQWKAELFEAGGDAVVNVNTAKEEALEEIRLASEDIVNAAAIAEQNAKNVLASAIKGNLKGEVVTADDVSPVEHEMNVKVRNKNHFDISKIPVMEATVSHAYISEVGSNYIVISTKDGYDGNGFCTVAMKLKDICPSLEIGKTYVLTATTESNSSNIYLPGIQNSWIFGKAMVMTEEILNSSITLYGLSVMAGMGTGACRISNIQIEEGETPTEYTPYIDPTTVNVIRCGKNLFDREASTRNLDDCKSWGQRILNAEKTRKIFKPNMTYTISFEVEGIDDLEYDRLFAADVGFALYCYSEEYSMIRVALRTSTKEEDWLTSGKKITYKNTLTIPPNISDADYELFGYTQRAFDSEGTAFLNRVKFNYVQIELNETATPFEPYKGTEHTPSSDGTVSGMMSTSPNMTILTDTEGAVIECEYIIDTKTYIDKKFAALGV